ncbi:MAG: O-antigen ligase family protein [Betaproteobacteria bacterium]
MRDGKGRAARLSLFFIFCAALCLLAAALLQGNAYRWGALALLVFAFWAAPAKALPANWLVAAVALYCAWLFFSAAFIAPGYSVDALYRPLALLGGFVVAATLEREALIRLFRYGVELLAVLVLLGLLQFFIGFLHLSINPQRAAATFITPNTFASAINLFLLPLIALTVTGRGGWQVFAAALWLYAGLLATESRGGWVAGLAGLAFIVWYLGVPRTREGREPWLRLIAGLLWVFIAFSAALRLIPLLGDASRAGLADTFGETVVSRGTSYRIDIYEVALDLVTDHPLTGYGADMFRFLYEMHKPVKLDMGHSFIFVHSDYLQTWVEFGLVGLALLGAVVGVAAAMVARARRAGSADSLPFVCGAALTGILTHALVDFPLWIPFLLLILGMWLGALAADAGSSERLASMLARAGGHFGPLRTPLIVRTVTVAGLAWLSQPMLAEAAGNRAVAELLSGRADSALYWQSVARRLEPRNAAHYWVEGTIWRDQAVEARDRMLAAKADMLFADGMRTDPYQIVNFLERARLRRTHAELFEGRSEREILEWTGEAVRLRPYSLPAQAERALSLEYLGRQDEAQQIARRMLERHPGTEMARGLAAELKLPGAPGKPQ